MRGKTLFSIFSALVCVTATAVFFSREERQIKIRENESNEPKITMGEFEYFKFKNDKLSVRLAGKNGALFDGGLVRMTDGVRAVRHNETRREELSAREAELALSGSNPSNLNTLNQIKRIRVHENVELLIDDGHFETEEAIYTDDDGVIRTDKPVRMERGGQFVASEGGFDYGVRSENLKMRGGVTGTLLPQLLKQKDKKERP